MQADRRSTAVSPDSIETAPHIIAPSAEHGSSNQIPCVYQTHIWRQLSLATKAKITETLEIFDRERKVFFVSALNQLQLELFSSTGNRG